MRRVNAGDASLLYDWIRSPHVSEYYEESNIPPSLEAMRRDFIPEMVHGTTHGCIVEYRRKPIGYIQFYALSEDDLRVYGYPSTERVYGMDQFIGDPAYRDRGMGTGLVTSMAEYLFEAKGADRVVMDPQTWNARALRCYEKCGFKRVKLLPEHEMHGGVLRDCWLIERTKDRSRKGRQAGKNRIVRGRARRTP